jgi:cyclopropane fatty-acyl-phospholipid synthase-like methyltransferase
VLWGGLHQAQAAERAAEELQSVRRGYEQTLQQQAAAFETERRQLEARVASTVSGQVRGSDAARQQTLRAVCTHTRPST